MTPDEATRAIREHAPGLYPLLVKEPAIAADVLVRPIEAPTTADALRHSFADVARDLPDGDELRRALRRLRHRAMVRVALREVLRIADVDDTSREISDVASAAIDAALAAVTRDVCARLGTPRTADGRVVPLVVLGMGKLGGGELNLGSDVDLCFFHETDDAEVEGSDRSVQEVYGRVVSATAKVLADVTEDGFCFRVDLRLRSEGSRGALTCSLSAAERYYESFGRTWERAAFLRARPVAGDRAFGAELLETLRPFVWRREVRPALARELAEMVERTRRELSVDDARNVKLGRGGIREAELFVQTLQLVWGGRHPELRVPGTMDALGRLAGAGLVGDREARDLAEAWSLLRRVEHRIHVRTGYQTHDLPPAGTEEAEAIARSLGRPSFAAFERELGAARDRVHGLFVSLQGDEPTPDPELSALADLVASGASAAELREPALRVLGVTDGDEAAAHLARLGRRASSPLGPQGRARAPQLGPKLLAEARAAADPDHAVAALADFFARLGSLVYERLWLAEPRLSRRLVGLFGTSATLSEALVAHPEDVDRLLAASGPPEEREIRDAHDALASTPDPEAFLAALRREKREISLRIGLAHTAGEADLARVTRLFTALAEAQVRAALAHARQEARAESVPLAVVGMGKLGGRELGFGSDLDVLFVFDAAADDHEAGERATEAARRTMRLLSHRDAEGPGWGTDTRLRPSGSHGLLVVTLAGFARYQATQAADWERMALVRARPVAGDEALSARLADTITAAAYGHGGPDVVEIARIRGRMERELAGEKRDLYHPKLGHGALVDVELLAQAMQMRHGDDARVRLPHTREALAALGSHGYLSGTDAETLLAAQGFLRSVEQALRLLDETREPLLRRGSIRARQVARLLAVRDRDGTSGEDSLFADYVRHASAVRALFERHLAPVGVASPFPEAAT